MSGRHGAGPGDREPVVPAGGPPDERPRADAPSADHLTSASPHADTPPEDLLPDGPAPEDPELDLLAALYATGSIEGEELVVFEARLAIDPTARARVAELHEALAGVGGADEVAPPAHLKDAVMGRLASTAQVPADDASAADLPEEHPQLPADQALATVTPLRRRAAGSARSGPVAAPPRQNRRRPLVALLAAAAAAVLVLGIGAVGWTALQGRQQQQAVQAAVSRVADAPDAVVVTASSDTSPGWTAAHVVYSASEGRAAVVDTATVPELDGREYQLWFVTDEGVRSAGLMTSQDAGAVLEGDMAAASAVAVTVEPEGGSTTPSGDPVAVFEMPTA